VPRPPESTAAPLDIHVVVLSWPGFEPRAQAIEDALAGSVRKISVIHSLTGESDFLIPHHWRVLPDGSYYGVKFDESLRLHDHGLMLHIQADASFADWPALVRRCVAVHERFQRCGVWTPEIRWSAFRWKRAFIQATSMRGVSEVSLTDGIVWSISQPVIERLRQLDYEKNPLGWGFELSAAAFCRVNGLLVLHDHGVVVKHPQGTGYSMDEASRQQLEFIAQLADDERAAAKAIVKDFHRDRAGLVKRTLGHALLETRRFLHRRGWWPSGR